MNLTHVLSELRAELKRIEAVILVLERLAAAGGKRSGGRRKRTASEQSGRAASTVLKPKR
jgi:hypothetical protein